MPDLVTTDIDNFWRAFDAADRLPTSDRVKIFESAYFDVASKGMLEFIGLRLGDVEQFERVVTTHDAYYRSARVSMMRIREFEGEIRHYYKRFDRLYPPLKTPRVTFVVGRLSCGGTTGQSGLLIGAEMFGRTERMPEQTLDAWRRSVIKPVTEIPSMVIHELVHVQQKSAETSKMSLLAKSIREGMAVYVTERVTRRPDPAAPHEYGLLHEEELWQEFRKVMEGTDASDWLSNGANSVGRPADLGYFIGCQICRAFVEKQGRSGETMRRLMEVEAYEEILEVGGYGGSVK
jgi:hypothetical protein